ncbi:MAG: Hpt domain-containing protein [Bacteroidota bacterium]|nr:Hpt domain-containing protein [Bacteroidota bacterium]
MGNETLPNQFIFSEKMDAEALYNLYAGDYLYVEEIFATTLEHFDGDFGSIQLAYENGNTEELRKAVHKIKPTFGYVGLTALQDECKQFENACAGAQSIQEISKTYIPIKNALLEAKDLIQKEYDRLKAFNASQL